MTIKHIRPSNSYYCNPNKTLYLNFKYLYIMVIFILLPLIYVYGYFLLLHFFIF